MRDFVNFNLWFLERLNIIIANSILNSITRDDYDYLKESLVWARKYFPMYSDKEFLEVAKRYEVWNTFEKEFIGGLNDV